MFLSMIRKRRSIRKYQDRSVEPEKINTLIEAALRSPSSRGLNPWEFILVRDKTMLANLSTCKPHGAAFLKGAALGIVIVADPKTCDVWVEDTSIAATYIQLAAEALGLSSCWIQIRKREYGNGRSSGSRVRDLLSIPAHLEVSSIIALGYPAQNLPGHLEESLTFPKVHEEVYGNIFKR